MSLQFARRLFKRMRFSLLSGRANVSALCSSFASELLLLLLAKSEAFALLFNDASNQVDLYLSLKAKSDIIC